MDAGLHRSELQCLSGLHYSERPVRQRHRRSGLLFLEVSLNASLRTPLRLCHIYRSTKQSLYGGFALCSVIEYPHLSMLSCTVILSGWWDHRQSRDDHVWLRAVGSEATHLACSPLDIRHPHARTHTHMHTHRPDPVASTINFPLEGLLVELLCWWLSGGRYTLQCLECSLAPPLPPFLSSPFISVCSSEPADTVFSKHGTEVQKMCMFQL